MNNNIYGIDFGTCNFKVFSKASGKFVTEKNTIALINKNQMYAYGDEAYAMYEKAPESINVVFPLASGVIADYNFLQTMIFEFIEKRRGRQRMRNSLLQFLRILQMLRSVLSLNFFTKVNRVQRMSCFVRNLLQMQLVSGLT